MYKKALFFLFIFQLVVLSSNAQNSFVLKNANLTTDESTFKNITEPNGDLIIEFNYPTNKLATYGCETDGEHFYVACHHNQHAPGALYKFDNQGAYVDSIVLPIVGAIAMAYDGEYFYTIGSIGNVFDEREIYVWDFTNSFNNPDEILIDTISFLPPDSVIWDFLSMNCAAYSPDEDAFWIGNWTTTALQVNKNGEVIDAFSGADLGEHNLTGLAYDNETAGGPYLWAADVDNDLIRQYHLPSKTYTGNAYSYTPEINTSGEMFLNNDIIPGKRILGLYGQGGKIVGYDIDESISVVETDLVVNKTNMELYFLENTNVEIITNITNNGLESVTSFEYNYQINSGEVYSMEVATNLESFESMDFTHEIPWQTEEGTVELKIWTANPNGGNDQNTENDTIVETKFVYANGAMRKRVILHEEFTSSTCGPCVGAAQHLQELFSNNNSQDYNFVAYQMNWPGTGDIYYDPQGGGIRKNYYDVSGIPHMNVDGYEINPYEYTQQIYDERLMDSCLMELEATWYLDNEEAYVNVYINPTFSFNEDLKLFVTVIENKTEGNVGGNGQTEFHNVEMKMLPNGNGTLLDPLESGITTQINLDGSLSNTNVEEWDDLAVIVWVQNAETREVIQSAKASIYTSLNKIPESKLSAYQANNNEIRLRNNERNREYFIYDINGRIISQGFDNNGSIRIDELNAGIYLLKFDVGQDTVLLKFIKQ